MSQIVLSARNIGDYLRGFHVVFLPIMLIAAKKIHFTYLVLLDETG
jgi:hypothetical protein